MWRSHLNIRTIMESFAQVNMRTFLHVVFWRMLARLDTGWKLLKLHPFNVRIADNDLIWLDLSKPQHQFHAFITILRRSVGNVLVTVIVSSQVNSSALVILSNKKKDIITECRSSSSQPASDYVYLQGGDVQTAGGHFYLPVSERYWWCLG